MRLRLAALSAVLLLVAACAAPAPSSQPTSSQPAAPLPTAGELYLVTLLDDAGPSFGVRVEAVGPTGRSRPIATIADARPAAWEGASPSPDFEPSVGPTGLLALVVERNGGNEDSDVRTLLIDVTGKGRPTVEVHGRLYRPSWSPNGDLMAVGSEPITVDPITGRSTTIELPERVELPGPWLAHVRRRGPLREPRAAARSSGRRRRRRAHCALGPAPYALRVTTGGA